MEFKCKIGDTCFINDAKSTTIDSTIACYNAFYGNKLLICGGKDKGIDFSILNTIDNVCVYGQIKEKINGYKEERLKDLYDYIKMVYKNYDYVIFSPSTSSFDQYKSYVERGMEFNDMVSRLKYEETNTR
jgi:UDP-N-acetylmuramoylalanine--D-glutamate ligase